MDKEKIINAIKGGATLRRISREYKIPIATLSTWCNGRDKEITEAYIEFKISVNNLFL